MAISFAKCGRSLFARCDQFAHLPELPHLADDAVNYLSMFRSARDDIDEEIAAMLANGAFSLYPPVERRVIQYLTLAGVVRQRLSISVGI